MTYDATGLTPHPAFAKFDRSVRQDCAEAFYARDPDGMAKKVNMTIVVDGQSVGSKVCPLAYCLIRSLVAQPILMRRYLYAEHPPAVWSYSVGLVTESGYYIHVESPEWWQIALAFGEIDPDTDERFTIRTLSNYYGRPASPEYPNELLALTVKFQSVATRSPYFAFYSQWDDEDIPPTEFVRDWLGIDQIAATL
jgi:hypothetical protein